MSFTRPTLSQLVDRIQADFVSRLDLAGAVLRRALVYVISRVIAGAAHMLHGHLEFLGRQIFPDLAEEEFLLRHAALYGITRTEPTVSLATVTFTGTNGTTIPAATRLTSSAGVEYEVQAPVVIALGVAVATIASITTGSATRLVVGAVLTLQSPIAGVNATAAVTTVVQDGDDTERLEALRIRLLEYLAEPAHGGTVADYVAWAKEISGVTRVWVTPLGLGPGTVLVRFARDNDSGGAAPAIPDAGEIAAVQAKLDAEAPAHATVTVGTLVDRAIVFDVTISPAGIETVGAVVASIEDHLRTVGEPGVTILRSGLLTAIGSTPGLVDWTLNIPSGNVTIAANELPRLDLGASTIGA
jgi:uncharacterized phage protein gp47/JayE